MEIKSFVLIEKEGKFLLICEATEKWKGKWYLPGGSADINESPEAAAHRETKEEAGCDINIHGIFYIKYKSDLLKKTLSIYYTATITGEQILKQKSDKHSLAVKWYTYEEIKTLPLRQDLLEIIERFDKNSFINPNNLRIE